MKHIRIVCKGKSPIVADSLGCTLCVLKNGGDRDPCEDSGKCAHILTPP